MTYQTDLFGAKIIPINEVPPLAPEQPSREAPRPGAASSTPAERFGGSCYHPEARLRLPRRVQAWEDLIDRSTVANDVLIVVQLPGAPRPAVIEVLSDPVLGRFYLHDSMAITEAVASAVFGRVVFMIDREAEALNKAYTLVSADGGRQSSHFLRFCTERRADTITGW